MGAKSLGEFIEAARAIGEVKEVHGASLDMDVGCLTELAYEQDGPMLLFDRFKGYPSDFRVVSNVYRNNIRRWALALGFPLDAHPGRAGAVASGAAAGAERVAPRAGQGWADFGACDQGS